MPTYDIDGLLQKHDWIYRVIFDINGTLGDDQSQWTWPERVIIKCSHFNVLIGNGFRNFLGCVPPRHLFSCLEGLRAVRSNVSSRATELVVSALAEYGIRETEEATWDLFDDFDEESTRQLETRIREIDDMHMEAIINDRGPDSLHEALTEFIKGHIDDLRVRRS